MNKNRVMASLLVLFVLIAVGSFGAAIFLYQDRALLQKQLAEMEEQPAQVPTPKAPSVVVESSKRPADSKDVEALNAYITKLEKEKAALSAQLASANSQNEEMQRRGNRRGRGQRMNLEQLKESNPEEYNRIMSFREQMEKRMTERANKRKAYFSSLDTSKMSAEQKSTLEDYQVLLDDMENARKNPDGDRREMFQMMRDANEMRGAVQNILLDQLGSRLGVEGSSLSDGVTEILDITGNGGPGMGGPGGPGAGGPGPGGQR